MLADSNRVHQIDKKFKDDVSSQEFTNQLFIRLISKSKRFTKVKFRYSIFESCYLRQCTFEECDFTGCRFVGTNFHGSVFNNCEFRYSTFEKTLVDSSILDRECPEEENLKMRFARSLRLNYQSLGDAESANKAMNVELQATDEHLYKSWHSNAAYYRNKYKDWHRLGAFLRWFKFKLFDIIWGNGENPWKLLRAICFIFALIGVFDVLFFGNPQLANNYWQAIWLAPQIFLGTFVPQGYPTAYLTVILFVRLVAFGFFMSILLKRFNRR